MEKLVVWIVSDEVGKSVDTEGSRIRAWWWLAGVNLFFVAIVLVSILCRYVLVTEGKELLNI